MILKSRFNYDVNSPPEFKPEPSDLCLLDGLLKVLPKNLLIINGEVELEAVVIKEKMPNFPGNHLYYLIYDGPDIQCYKDTLQPFAINFQDGSTKEINGNCYIANFHKTCKYSGTQVICTVLKFLKCLKVKTVELWDGSSPGENYVPLSLIKLVELGRTFYNKFGFKFNFISDLPLTFGTYKNLKEESDESSKQMDTIKVKTIKTYYAKLFIILADVVNNNIEIDYYISLDGNKHEKNIDRTVLFAGLKKIIAWLSLSDDMSDLTLRKLMSDLVKKKNTELMMDILGINEFGIYTIKNKKTKLTGTFLQPLMTLSRLSSAHMTMDLTKIKMKDICQ